MECIDMGIYFYVGVIVGITIPICFCAGVIVGLVISIKIDLKEVK